MQVREAFSGRWGADVRGFLVMSALTAVIAAMQETLGPAPDLARTIVVVLAQFAVSAGWTALVAGVSRHATGRIVPVASAAIWLGLGLLRGTVGALAALAWGVDPEWAYRLSAWIVLSVVWIPITTFALAALDEHRQLISQRAAARRRLLELQEAAAGGAVERARPIADALDDALRPAIEEVRALLNDDRTSLDDDVIAAAMARVETLAERAAEFTVPVAQPAGYRFSEPVSMVAAIREFEVTRASTAAAVTAVAVATLVVPEAFREGGWAHVAESLVAISASALGLVGSFAILRRLRVGSTAHSTASYLGTFLAGTIGAALLLLLPWEPFEPRDFLSIALYPFYVVVSAAFVAIAVGIARANAKLSAIIREKDAAIEELEERIRSEDDHAAAELDALVRGEINGRLAACAMALGFLGSGGIAEASRDGVVATVLEHLDAAARELDVIAGSRRDDAEPTAQTYDASTYSA